MLRHRKVLVALGAIVLVIGAAVAAFAFWTASGSGTGSGTAASGSSVTLHASFTSSVLAPGGSVPVSYTADNDSTTTSGKVTTVKAVITTSDAGCLPAWFSLPDVVEDQVIAPSASGVALANGGTLSFSNLPTTDQNACKSATITLTLSSASS